ncbi:MAG TPA: tetratricopeptide repeat protein [Gemmatimonadaceae bacterium]|nr:tetratricopeptide repeat protein [Gemmatimonadaceae bacterium]
MVTVQLLGGACLRSGDAPVTGPPAQRHRIALLALIASAWPQPVSRDKAMAMLWPEKDLPSARRLLNLAVHVLRAALGDDAIASTGDGLLFNPTKANCDLLDLRAAIDSDASERVARLYTAPLLDGFHLDDSAEFGYWLDEQRNELSHAYVAALLTLAQRQEQSGDLHGRVRTCLRLVAADPHSSLYAQHLMNALDSAGDRLGAIQHAAEHARRRRADLDLDADPAVVALAERLRKAPIARFPAAVNARTMSSIAVLPFINLSSDAETESFADGITDDVIAHLSKIRALKVISHTSVIRFKKRQQSLKEIGNALGATTLLDASIRRSGDRIRIVAKLIDVQSDQHLWVETYDRNLTDIFEVQTDVALQIAAAMKAELSREERTRVERGPTKDIPAYQLFLRGREYNIKYTPDGLLNAIEFFEKAIARDPDFALAHAYKSTAYTELAESGFVNPEIAYPRAMEASRRALELDPESGAAHCTLGYLKGVYEYDWRGAEEAFKKSIELAPSHSDSYVLYGRMLAGLGRFDEALALQERAHELSPLAHRMDRITTLLRAGRLEEAVPKAEAAVEFEPGYDRARSTLGWSYFLNGNQSAGIAELERAVAVAPGNTLWLGQLGQAYAMAGDETKAREIIAQLEDFAHTKFVSPYHFAYVYAGLGDADRAIDYLEQAVIARTGPAYAIKSSFLLTSLHNHPRFHALLREMRLE